MNVRIFGTYNSFQILIDNKIKLLSRKYFDFFTSYINTFISQKNPTRFKMLKAQCESLQRSHWFFARENDFNPMGYLCTGLSKRIATLMVNSPHMDLQHILTRGCWGHIFEAISNSYLLFHSQLYKNDWIAQWYSIGH